MNTRETEPTDWKRPTLLWEITKASKWIGLGNKDWVGTVKNGQER